jgi:hypothetical protein
MPKKAPSRPLPKLLEIEWMTTIHQSGTSRSIVAPVLPVAINAGEFSITRAARIPYAKIIGTEPGFINATFKVESFDITGDASITVFVGGLSGGPSHTIGRARTVIAKSGMSTPFMVSTVFTDHDNKDYKFIFQGVIINNR